MANQLKEYTGIGASGGNSTDGNNIPSPRPFVDDEAELNNYLEKNRYGGEGNHYRKEPALPNPNRTRFTKFEENMDQDRKIVKITLKSTGESFYGDRKSSESFKGLFKNDWMNKIKQGFSSPLYTAVKQNPDMDSWDYQVLKDKISKDEAIKLKAKLVQKDPNNLNVLVSRTGDYGQQQTIKLKKSDTFKDPKTGDVFISDLGIIKNPGLEKKVDRSSTLTHPTKGKLFLVKGNVERIDENMKEGDLDLGHEDNEPHMIKGDLYHIGKNSMHLYKMVDQFDEGGEVDFPAWWQAKITKARDYLKGAKEYLDFELKKPQIDIAVNEEDNINLKENKMEKSDLLEDYMSSRKDINLNEQMETYRKEAKRSILMESAYQKFQELFDMGRTDEEVILDYANKGVQVPMQMVKRFREQYNKMKEMKLEYMKNEMDFKNEASDIVNNPSEEVMSDEKKSMSSGIYESKKSK